MSKKSLWETYTPEQRKEMEAFCDAYKDYMSNSKTERECVTNIITEAKELGYISLEEAIASGANLGPGSKIYADNRGKMLMLVQLGMGTFIDHMNILGGHVDSPRIDLKPSPIYEDSGFAMLKTHYYGGIKKYQWLTLPLALHGVVAKKDGRLINVVIGEDASDPVFGISDLLPHFDKDMRSKPIGTAFTGEDLNICFGSIPSSEEGDEPLRRNVLAILKEKYDIDEDDFMSAEFEAVPAGRARDFGIDRSLIMAYGHDDRICSYTSAEAQLAFADTVTERTMVTLLVDKEEIGSVGASGMQSHFFENAIAEIMELAGEYSEMRMRRTLAGAKMLSSDVTNGFDPNYPSIHDKTNAPFFGFGPTLHKYTGAGGKGGSNDATPQFIASLRQLFDSEEIKFQLAELGKVDQGGGGTIAYIMANYNMDVIDLGIPVHSMHAPWELAAKCDIYEAFRAYKAFLSKM